MLAEQTKPVQIGREVEGPVGASDEEHVHRAPLYLSIWKGTVSRGVRSDGEETTIHASAHPRCGGGGVESYGDMWCLIIHSVASLTPRLAAVLHQVFAAMASVFTPWP